MNRSDEIQDHCCYAGTSLWQCPKCSLMFKNLLLVALSVKDMMVPSRCLSLFPQDYHAEEDRKDSTTAAPCPVSLV